MYKVYKKLNLVWWRSHAETSYGLHWKLSECEKMRNEDLMATWRNHKCTLLIPAWRLISDIKYCPRFLLHHNSFSTINCIEQAAINWRYFQPSKSVFILCNTQYNDGPRARWLLSSDYTPSNNWLSVVLLRDRLFSQIWQTHRYEHLYLDALLLFSQKQILLEEPISLS